MVMVMVMVMVMEVTLRDGDNKIVQRNEICGQKHTTVLACTMRTR